MKIRYIKRWIVMILFTSLAQFTYSQRSSYIATDTSAQSGLQLIEGSARTNARFIQSKKGHEVIKYYPDQLKEYGLKDGTVYESTRISVSGQGKHVFLKRLEEGKINLYYYVDKDNKTFYLKNDSTVFIELKKGPDFRNQLSQYINDFDWKANQYRLVSYNRKSLSKLVSFYNNGVNKPLPFARFGIIAGYRSTSLSGSSGRSIKILDSISFTPNSSITLGLFGDLPIDMSNLSLNMGFNLSKSGFSSNSRSAQSDVDVIINHIALDIPLLLRYTFPTLSWRPFFNAGSTVSYHLRNESNVYEASFDENEIRINDVQDELLISEFMAGYSFGIGVQRNLSYRKIAALELRLNQLFGKENTLNKTHFEILTGLSF